MSYQSRKQKILKIVEEQGEADVKELFKKNFNEIESFLQQNGLKKLILPLSQGGLNSFEKESSNYSTFSLPAKIKKAVEAEIM